MSNFWTVRFFCRAMLYISATIAVMRCPSVRPSVTFVDHVKTNKHTFDIFFHHRWLHHSNFSIQKGWRYSDGNRLTMQVGYRQKSRFWSNSWLSKIAGRAKCQTFTDDKADYMTQSATHHWLSIDCWTCELRSDKNSYRGPCSVDRTVGDSPANVRL